RPDGRHVFFKGKVQMITYLRKNATVSYQIQIRNDGNENYVRRIDKTLYIEPYGTTILYIDDQRRQ
uniref:hypothetical protein n=1 Tax=Roseburia sp. AM23-20 TaxID=2292066 RepID=UPI000FF04FE6